MPRFQILYLRENVLDHSEEIDVRDLLDAIDQAMTKAPYLAAEIRSDGERVGLVGPSFTESTARSMDRINETDQRLESEIAEEMKIRLQLVR